MKVPSSHSSHFDLALAYSGLPSHNSQSLPIGIDGTNGPIDSTAHHRMPLTIALDLSRQINERWSLNAGLHYTMLSSDFQNGNTLSHIDRSQTVRYLGFSLGTTYQLWPAVVGNASERYSSSLVGNASEHYSQRRNAWKRCPLRLYVSASVAFDLPLRSTSETTYIQNGLQIGSENLRLHPSTQWSLGLGLGLQYSITPGVGFFVEPSLRYYIPNDDDIETWRTEHPFTFGLPLGLRITF